MPLSTGAARRHREHAVHGGQVVDVTVAEVVADALGALEALANSDSDDARGALERILLRAGRLEGGGVTVAAAAGLLGVSQPTVRTWMSRGVLKEVKGTKPIRVTAASLGQVLHTVQDLRSKTDGGRLLPRALVEIQDLRAREGLRDRIAQLDNGAVATVTSDDFSELFD